MPFNGDWLSAGENGERSDIAVSHVDTPRVKATGVSLRGYGHLRNGKPLQDAHAVGVVPDSSLLVALVADGSGRYPHSHWLSEVVVRSGWRCVAETLHGAQQLPHDVNGLVAELHELAMTQGRRLCHYLGVGQDGHDHDSPAPLSAEEIAQQMACTLQFVLLDTETLEYLWVDVAGDGSAYWRDRKARLHVIQQGTDELGENSWTPPLPLYRGDPLVHAGRLKAGDMLMMVTDGIGEALLNGKTPESISFSSRLQTRPSVFNIASFVSTIGLHDKDDKTLVLMTT
ncbi:protein phosphatase 2C domain-containing protein [Stomatohabitans albus]|uniref:protein phosphatase 2C domain-containing protein n=1 Tax=Stomatohabitans albus TaxID=3110766 RepID=UPI00300CAA95